MRKTKKKQTLIKQLQKDILTYLQIGGATRRKIIQALGLKGKKQVRLFSQALRQLIEEGKVLKQRNIYLATGEEHLIQGILELHREGYGFVIPEDGGEDVFIPPGKTGGAMNGDLVICTKTTKARGRYEGKIIEVIERARTGIVGIVRRARRGYIVYPSNPRVKMDVMVPKASLHGAKPGELVRVAITKWTPVLAGEVVEIIGDPLDPSTDTISVIKDLELKDKFPRVVLASAEKISPQITDEEKDKRKHFRGTIFTIDPEDAKDFDDAVSIKKHKDGSFTLGVYIADVSHYIPEDSPVDIEAKERGTSVYFPDTTLHMLPPHIATVVCSLREGVERLVLGITMKFSPAGELVDHRIEEGIIKSTKRLSYKKAQAILDGKTKAPKRIAESLQYMAELADMLHKHRLKRGTLNIELPEAKVITDEKGEVKGIEIVKPLFTHKIIEEFMIRTNEVIAEYLSALGIPLIYRVHEEPDPKKIKALKEMLKALGLTMKGSSIHSINKLLSEVEGKPYQYLVEFLVLRSMKRARYVAQNIGHFGLGSTHYTHFTSPIRRYPDLMVHRILKQALQEGKLPKRRIRSLENTLPKLAEDCTRAEWKAEEAERAVIRIKKLRYLSNHIGEEFDGVITGVSPQALTVEISSIMIDGSIPVIFLPPDNYKMDNARYILKGKKKIFKLGQRVKVIVERVDIENRALILSMAE